MVKKLWGYL